MINKADFLKFPPHISDNQQILSDQRMKCTATSCQIFYRKIRPIWQFSENLQGKGILERRLTCRHVGQYEWLFHIPISVFPMTSLASGCWDFSCTSSDSEVGRYQIHLSPLNVKLSWSNVSVWNHMIQLTQQKVQRIITVRKTCVKRSL